MPSWNDVRDRLARAAASPVLRVMALGVAGLGALALIAVLAALAALQFGPVRANLGERAIAMLGEGEGITVEVGGYSGIWPVALGITELTVRDGGEAIVRARDIRLGWAPFALLSGTVRVTELSAASIEVLALPGGAEADPDAPGGPAIPRLPVAVALDRLSLPDVRLAPGVAGAGDVHLGAEGRARLSGGTLSLDLAAARRDGGDFALDLALAYAPDDGTVRLDLDLTDGAAGAPGLIAGLTGDPALARVRATAASDGPADDWTGSLDVAAGGYGRLTGTARGSWRTGGTLAFSLDAAPGPALGNVPAPLAVSGEAGRTREGFAAPRLVIAAGDLGFDGRLAAEDPFGAPAVSIAGDVTGLGPALGAQALPDTVTLDLAAQADAALETVTVERLSLTAPGQTAAFAGRVSLAQQAVEGTLTAALDDVAGLAALAGVEAAGPLTLDAEIARATFAGEAGGRMTARFEPTRLPDPALLALTGPALDLTLKVSPAERGATRIETLTLAPASGAFTARASGLVSADGAGLAATLDVPDLAVLAPLAGTDLAGGAQADIALDGPFDALALSGTVTLAGAEAAGVDVAGTLSGELALAPLAGPVRFEGSVAGAPARAALRLAARAGGGMEFADIELAALGLDGTGSGGIAPAGGADLDLSGRVAALGPLGRLAGTPMAGGGTFRVRIEPGDAGAALEAGLSLSGVRVAGTGIQAVELAARRAPAGAFDARLRARGVTGPGGAPTLSSVTVSATGAPDALDVAIEAEGIGFAPGGTGDGRLGLAARADVPGGRATVARLDGRLADVPVALERPAEVTFARGFGVDPLALALGEGAVRGRVARTQQRLDADLALDAVPVRLLAALAGSPGALDGTLDGSARLAGAGTGGEGEVALRLAPRVPGTLSGEAPDLVLDATWAQGRARAVLTADAPGADDLRLEAAVPMRARAGMPFLADGAVLDASASGRADLAALWTLVPVDGHRMEGMLDLDLAVRGPLRDPVLAGTARLDNGLYENLDLGLLLSPLSVSARVEGAGGTLEVTARDGSGAGSDGGRLAGSGRADLAGTGADPRLDVRLDLDRFTVVRRDEVTAIASGTLTTRWPAARGAEPVPLTIGGEVTVDRLDARIPDRLASDVETIEVTRVTAQGVPVDPRETDESADAAPSVIALDMAIDVPARAFVRGRGLDSEWAGAVKISGTADAPSAVGTFSVVRGTFDFLGRSFDLEGGSVEFTGGAEIDPLLNVRAVHEAEGITAIVRVTGPSSDPAVEVTSIPPLPQEEVLARVLFGTGTGQLSALQAVELAQATASLTGIAGGGGGGIIDAMRRSLGVDVLAVGESGVEVGSYVRDGVYVGVSQGLDAGSGKVSVEVELTDDISVESNVGTVGDARVGVTWERDY